MSTATITATRHHRRPRRHLAIAVLGAALLSAAACDRDETSSPATRPSGTSATSTTPTTSPTSPGSSSPTTRPSTTTAPATPSTTAPGDVRPTGVQDALVGAERARVHVHCAGSGATTVLLIAGYEAGSETWRNVESALSAQTRTCSYDRPGTGASDPATTIATFATQAADLHELLATIGEPGPYVLVGHSFGGAAAVSFASAFPDEVTGLVLVDASPVTWPDTLCAVADDGSSAATIVRGLCDGWSDPTSNAEHLDVLAAFAGTAAITSLGSLPMAVITAVDRQLPAGLDAGEVARLTGAWDDGQRQWSQLSSASHLVSVDDTSHDIQLDHPDVVIDEIVGLLP